MKTNTSNPIKALIEIPNWLGDCVMFTPAFDNIINYYNDIEITIFGSSASIELIKKHPKVVKTLTIDSKNKFSYKTFADLGCFDVFFSFRGSIRAKIIKFIISATNKYQYNHDKYPKRHQVEKYVDFVNDCLNTNSAPGSLSCYLTNAKSKGASRILGINPGASYGSAKRWYPKQFAKIAIELSDNFETEIVLRDENEELMNRHLTNGGKSIPITVIIDAQTDEVLGHWGPRPIAAQQMVMNYKAKPESERSSYDDFVQEIQHWYNKDKTASIQKEFIQKLTKLLG